MSATAPSQSAIGNAKSAITTPVPSLLRPAPHPIVPFPLTNDEIDQLLYHTHNGPALYAEVLTSYNARLAQAEEDPLFQGLELDCWKLADDQLADPDLDMQVNFGWNRGGGKTWRALKRLCEAALEYPSGEGEAGYLVLGETEDSSNRIQQPIVWRLLRRYIEHLNGKQGKRYKVNHSIAGGFTEGLLVMPAGPVRRDGRIVGWTGSSTMQFETYKGEPGKYEGWEFGARLPVVGRTAEDRPILKLAKRPDGTEIQNVAVVADEGLSLKWLTMLARRVPYRGAKIIWAYTPIHGMTPAIKEVVGTLKVEHTAPAVLLPNADVPGCPRGHMPVTGRCARRRCRAVYFHINSQTFHDYDRIVRKDCEGKTTEYIERMAYGFARDSISRQFGKFGPHNIVKPEHLPAVGTNYQINDPHDDRPWFTIWVRVTPGDRPDYYIYRDWPDAQSHGEWAVPTEREINEDTKRGWDGDRGPAQANQDFGIATYKKLWAQLESVPAGGPPERDPYRRKLQAAAPSPSPFGAERARVMGAMNREHIEERYIDSRAGPRPHIEEQGQLSVVQAFAEEQTDSETGAVLEPIHFQMASGQRIDLDLVRDLLEFTRDNQGRIVRMPRLFVSEDCQQVIWALENYTGRSGEDGACKDPIDDLRYMASGELYHVTDTTFRIRSQRERGEE